MNKDDYILKLKTQLRRLPAAEQREILADYEEHFRLGTEDGKSETEIAESLGNPVQVGRAYLIESALTRVENREKPVRNILRAVFAAMSLSFLNLIIGIPVIASLAAAIISLWAGALSCVLGGLGAIFLPAVQIFLPNIVSAGPSVSLGFFYVFGGIGALGIGGLFGLGMYYVSKGFMTLIKRYIRMTVNIIVK